MKTENLVQMANDLSASLAQGREPAQAAAEVATHLKRSWEPRMRRELVACWRSGQGEFSPITHAGVALLAAESDAAG
jgi:formate dehydrogenase subunit delta